jgi:hypothetical protein
MKQKVFVIGFHKTGTTSLALALRTLGYSVTGPNRVHDADIGKNTFEKVKPLIEKYDAFQDNPWPLLYKELDKAYPHSKFILTLRDTESWYQSISAHFKNKSTAMRKWIYGIGSPQASKSQYIKRYETHNKDVQNYFKDRPGDLLVMNLKEDGWEKLATFLKQPLPKTPFPQANTKHQRNTLKSTLFRKFPRLFSPKNK